MGIIMEPTEYLVNDIYPCIQGEGVLTGTPMIILRLQGCSVGCSFCDTKETWSVDPQNVIPSRLPTTNPDQVYGDDFFLAFGHGAAPSPHYVIKTGEEIGEYLELQKMVKPLIMKGIQWILLTGGEPAEQDLDDLCKSLKSRGFKIALETSGTAIGFLGCSIDWVCVSPKLNNPGKKEISRMAVAKANELKFVIGKESDLDEVDKFLSQYTTRPDVVISLQPMSLNKKATELCQFRVMERGWRLSLQTHKFTNSR